MLSHAARSALECGSEAERSCRLPLGEDKAVATRRLTGTAPHGAPRTFKAAKITATALEHSTLPQAALIVRLG